MRKKPVKKTAKAPKSRQRKTVENDENCLHLHCAAWVKKAHPDLLIFHVPNELKAHVSYHLKQKRLGKLNGVSDFLAFPVDGRKFAIELKDDEGVQDDDQIKFQKRWERTGGIYIVVRTLADFQSLISVMVLFSSTQSAST